MSILPVYLSSFSSVSPLQRGMAERLNSGQIDRTEDAKETETARKNDRKNIDETTRAYDELIIRSGDVVSNNGDVFSLSSEAKNSVSQSSATMPLRSSETTQANDKKTDAANTDKELSDEELQEVTKLKQRDTEVKAHEAAHLAAAGGLARGGASYEYQTGPDGKSYAVGGEVSIDTSSTEGDPESTIAKAQQIRGAALAPATPSSQDYKVAAKAAQMEAKARQELSRQQSEQQQISQDASQNGPSPTETRIENQKTQQSPYHLSKSAVEKYAVQSQVMTFRSQATFQAMA